MTQPKETSHSWVNIRKDVHTLVERSSTTGTWFRRYLYPGETALIPILEWYNDPDTIAQKPLQGMDLQASQRICKQILDRLGVRAYYFSAVHTMLDPFWRIIADASNLSRPDFRSLPNPDHLRARIVDRIRDSGNEFDKKLHVFLETELGQAFDLRIDRAAQTFTITDVNLSKETVVNKWAGVKKIIQTL